MHTTERASLSTACHPTAGDDNVRSCRKKVRCPVVVAGCVCCRRVVGRMGWRVLRLSHRSHCSVYRVNRKGIRMRLSKKVRVFLLGLKDGWMQPHELNTSTNVDHLSTTPLSGGELQNCLDWGVNWGQLLRAGKASQALQEGYRFFPRRWVDKP